jgi:hypothetical protein
LYIKYFKNKMAINSKKAGLAALLLAGKLAFSNPLEADDERVLIKTADGIIAADYIIDLSRDKTTNLINVVGGGDGEYDVMPAKTLTANLAKYFCTPEAKTFFKNTEAYEAFKGKYQNLDRLAGEMTHLSERSMEKLRNFVRGGYLTPGELAQIPENGLVGIVKRGKYKIDEKTGKRIEEPWSVGALVYIPMTDKKGELNSIGKEYNKTEERKPYAPRDFGQIEVPPALPKEKPKEEPVARSIRIDDNEGNITIIQDSDGSINIENYPPAPEQAPAPTPQDYQAAPAPQMPPAEEAKPQPLPPSPSPAIVPEAYPEKKESAYNIVARANAGFPLSYGGQIGVGGMKWSAGLNFGSRSDEHTVEVRERLSHGVVAEADEYLRKNILLGAFAEYRQPIGNFSLIGGVEGNVEFQTREATSALYNPNGELMNKNTGSFAEKEFIGGIYGGLGYTIKVDGSEKLGIDFTAGYRRGFKKVPEEEQSTGYPSNCSRGVNIGLGVRVPIKAPVNKHKGNR